MEHRGGSSFISHFMAEKIAKSWRFLRTHVSARTSIIEQVFVIHVFVKRVFANDFFGDFIVAIDSHDSLWYRAYIDIT